MFDLILDSVEDFHTVEERRLHRIFGGLCCTDLRNICAHYGRLYYRIFPAVPAGIQMPDAAKRRLWGAIMALRAVYPHSQKWNSEVLSALEALFDEYASDINLYHLAFPADWRGQLKK